jgi:5-methylthioadenosine/S-adenosylhomocysteine deaminase
MKTKLQARYVVGFDGKDHVIYRDGEVVFEGDTIIHVGHGYAHAVDVEIECGEAIVGPGFVDLNALGDIDHSIMHFEAPAAVSKGLMWSKEYVQRGTRETLTPEEQDVKILYALTHLVRNGITTALPVTSLRYKRWAETFEEFERVAKAAAKLGLRTYLGPTYRSAVKLVEEDGSVVLHWDESEGTRGLEQAVAFVRQYDGAHDGLIKGLLIPSTTETCTPDLLRQTKAYSDEFDCPIRLHAAQSMREVQLIREWHDKTPIEYLAGLGFLGPRALLAHAIYVDEFSGINLPERRDLDLLRDSRAVVIHCPLVTGRHGLALESFSKYVSHGIRLALGTDTFPPDMLLVMLLGSSMCKLVVADANACTAADWYRAATLWGAEALGRPDLGRLSPGAKADIVVFGLDNFDVGPVEDPIRTMMLNMSGDDVRTVIINGRTVMEDRIVPGVDLVALRTRGQEVLQKLKDSYTARDYLHRPTEELVPPTFEIVDQPRGE